MIYKQILGILGIAMAVNGAMFAIYRVVFLKLFGRPAPATDTLRVLRSGLRLDVAWLGIEVAAMGVLFLLQGWTSPRAVFCGFWFLTGFHVLISVSNVCTYAERNQTAGELLLPYITSPYQVYLAVMPFVQRHWLSMAALLVAGTGYVWGGLSLSRFVPGDRLAMWNLKAASFGLGLILMPVLLSLHFVARRKVGSSGVARGGWRLTTTKAKYYMNFTDYAFNQAVIVPSVTVSPSWGISTSAMLPPTRAGRGRSTPASPRRSSPTATGGAG